MHFDWMDVLSIIVSFLASFTGVYAILTQLGRNKLARRELFGIDISPWNEGGYIVPPNVEATLARVLADDAEIETFWREQRAMLRHVGCERWIFNIIDGPNRHRMEFISQDDADNFVRSIHAGFIHNMEQRVVNRDPLRTFGDPIAHVLPQRYELEYDLLINPMDAVERGGIPLRSNMAAERFGAAFGPLPHDYIRPDAPRIAERGHHFALGVRYMEREMEVGVHTTQNGSDFEFDPNPNIEPHVLEEIRAHILTDEHLRANFYEVMARQTGIPRERLYAGEQQRQMHELVYGAWDRNAHPERTARTEYDIGVDINSFTPPQPIMRETPTASSCFAVMTHEGHPVTLDEAIDFRLSDADARRLAERMQTNDRQEREARRRFERNMRHEEQSEKQKKEAHKKAVDLLRNVLTEAEIKELDELDTVTINTSEGLFRVRIDKDKTSGAPAYNVYHKRQKWCVNLSQQVNTIDDLPLNPEGYPTPDHYAMQILLLKTDPKRFMKTANKKPYDDD